MHYDKQQLLLGVLIGAVLCTVLGPSNQTLMGILAIVALVGVVLEVLKRNET